MNNIICQLSISWQDFIVILLCLGISAQSMYYMWKIHRLNIVNDKIKFSFLKIDTSVNIFTMLVIYTFYKALLLKNSLLFIVDYSIYAQIFLMIAILNRQKRSTIIIFLLYWAVCFVSGATLTIQQAIVLILSSIMYFCWMSYLHFSYGKFKIY